MSAIRDTAVAQVTGADDGDPIIATSEKFVRTIFPKGVNDMTSLGFIDELAAVEGIVKAFQGELAPIVVELGLTRLAERLTKLAVEYHTVLNAPDPEVVRFGDLRAARAQGQHYLLQSVAQIIGKHWRDTAEDVTSRAAPMAPILRQNEAIRQSLRAHRAPEEIDPITGEVEPSGPRAEAAPQTTP